MAEQYRFKPRFLDCKNLTMEEATDLGEWFAQIQRDIGFYVGDLARYAEARWPETHHQVWPPWISHGLLSRNAGVCKAYPDEEDRQHEATYSQYMQMAGKPDRQALLAAIVEQGLTTDESRKPKPPAEPAAGGGWLLAIDVNYYLHRFWHSGGGVEAASNVADWIERTVERLKEKGLTDVACCFDSPHNHRKLLTAEWEDKYKDRPPKPPELSQQLNVVRQLLEAKNFACVAVPEMEADDVMASYAKQFDGKVTIMTQDKDCRQCLSARCNMLLDVEWRTDDTSGDMVPEYKWVSAKSHTEDKGIPPESWIDYQCIAGDSCDKIKGVIGIGEKGAADLIKRYKTVEATIQAAKDGKDDIKPSKRVALIEFEAKLETTRKLVTLRDDLRVTNGTRI